MLKPILSQLLDKASLTQPEAEKAMGLILDGADPHQVAAFFAILKYRGETANEVAGFVAAMQKRAVAVPLPFPVMDIVGTGGDFSNSVNISTGACLLAAACGIPIAKHGNRSISSQSGSADLLEALGIKIESTPKHVAHCLQEAGIAFMYAPNYHPALAKLAPIRKGLRVPTVCNILGPLLNPAEAQYALIGAASESALELMSEVVLNLGHKRTVLLFHGSGLDELTGVGPVMAYRIQDGRRERLQIDPAAFGFARCTVADLRGGDAHTNAALLKEALAGKEGAIADALIFTAGAAVWIFGQAPTLAEGIRLARQVCQERKAAELIEKWRIASYEKS